eukprot:448343_1
MAAKKGTKAVKVHGTCGLQMQKCVCNLSRYNCASCHAVDTKDYLIKLPQYKPNSAKQCNWTGARKSYTRHSKRYHNTKKDHFHGFKPNKQKQSTRQPLREAHTESNRNEKNKKKRKINCILDTKKKTNPPFKFRKLNANSSSDARKMAVDHNHNKPSTNSNWLTQMAASQSANNNPINIESKCKSKPTAPAATSSNSSNQQRRIITADDLHNDKEYARWSKIKKEGINIYFGCRVCKQFARGKGKYGKDEWPLSVTVSDIVNKTNAWQRVKDSYRHHSVDANHIMCMGAAHNSDYFNTIALKNQLRARTDSAIFWIMSN